MNIHLWYGKSQRFGHKGIPQRWVNILGTACEAQRPVSVHYRLNGGPEKLLNIGPDGLRLRGQGDFNAEIACADLCPGANKVLLTAVDQAGQRADQTVTIEFTPDRRWPLPYRVRWDEIARIPDAVQIVEGQWQLTPQGIRPTYPAYDRLVTIGDRTWTDYQVQAKIIIHGFVESKDGQPTGGVGLLMRWTGHYADEHQPSREWRPSGAIGWYRARWEDQPARVRCLNISDGVVRDTLMVETPAQMLQTGVPYVFKCSVQSCPGATSLYTLRVWPDGQPDVLLCDLSTPGRKGESPQGSILFIALRADVTIGDIDVVAL